MKTGTSDRAATIFLALSQAPPDDHARLLDEQCGGDGDLRREVERLLEGLNEPDSFFEPAVSRPSARAPERVSHSAGALIGDFIVIRQIGSGGTGVVYLAHQQHPPRIVALKVLRAEFVASTVQRRFEIEAELLGHLHHPGIAQIYAAHPGDAATPPFIAMELVNGPPITEYADSRELSIRDRVDLIARACDAVQHAHQRGIIHRDLKPGNILVNEDGHPKVLDFGVARTMGAQVSLTTIETETGQLVGTLAYMSPEQVEATPQAIDTRTDIHALGVVLFRLLTGRLPFGHDHPALPELARRIMRDEPPRLSTIDPALRGDLDIIVARALAKEKDRRYASAADLATDLRRYLAGEPIAASHDSAWYVVRRRVRRYRLALALSAAVGVTLAALATYANLQRSRAAQVNVRLQDELAASSIERGRLLSLTGNLPNAEDLVWRELFKRPDSRHAQWTLWDIYSREPSPWRRSYHAEGTQAVRFSPDGRYVVSSGRADGLMRLIDAESGEIVRTFTTSPLTGTRRAMFSLDGDTIISGHDDGTLNIWTVATGAIVKSLPKAAAPLNDLALAADGTTVVTVAAGKVKVWSLATGQVIADFSGLVDRVYSAIINPAATTVIAGDDGGGITVLDVARRTILWRAAGHRAQVASLTFAPDARTFASGSGEGTIRLWSIDGDALHTIPTDNGRVRNLSFDRSGRLLAAAGQWKTRMWDLEQPAAPPRDFGGAEGTTDAHLRVDATALVTCHGASGQVRLWHLAADSRRSHWLAHGDGGVTALTLDAEASTALTASGAGAIAKWTLVPFGGGLWQQFTKRVNGLALSSNRRWLAMSGYPGTGAIFDMRDGRRVALLPASGPSRAVAFSDDSRHVLIGEFDGTLKTWDWNGETAVHARTISTKTDTEILAMTARGGRVYIAHRNQSLVEREIETGREVRRWVVPAAPFSVALSPDARAVAVGTWVGAVDVWDTSTGRLIHEFKGQTALINGIDFSPDSSLLVSSSRDGTTRLWDLRTGHWLATVASRKSGAEHVRFFPDGKQIVIGYQDGEVEIRDLSYFFRYVAGHAEYQLALFRKAGDVYPRADEAIDWSRQILSARRQ